MSVLSTLRQSLLLFTFLSILHPFLFAQDVKYKPEVEKKIREVENNLGLWFKLEGSDEASNRHTLRERMSSLHVNGISIAVIKNYKLEWARGYGWADSAEQRPVTTTTLFQAGGISKSLNSVGILRLVQEGKLNLSTDINDYLKTWKFPYDSISKGKKITLVNLLNNTAGLTVNGFPGYEADSLIPSLTQVLNGTKPANTEAVRSVFEPGLRYQFSGGGTTIAQLIVQDVTGKPYDTFMWENVLEPMGMLNSSYTQPPSRAKEKLLATAYYDDGKAVRGKYHTYPEQAAAGLWTNPSDLAKYIIESQLSLEGKSEKVLSQSMTKVRLTPFLDTSAALGVFMINKGGQNYFQNEGGSAGFVAQYYGSMNGGNGVIVMANTSSFMILNEVLSSVATVYGWKDFYNPLVKKTVPVSSEVLRRYLGKYKNPDGQIFTAVIEGSNLFFVDVLNVKYQAYFTTDTDFFFQEEANVDYSYLKDTNNKVIGIRWRSGDYTLRIEKVSE